MDLNGDGQISWEEFQRCYLENMPPIPDPDLRELFDRIVHEQTLTEAEARLYMKQLLSAIHH